MVFTDVRDVIDDVFTVTKVEQHKWYPRASQLIIQWVIIGSWCLFAGIIAYNISLYTQIPFHWKVAISAFIFLLPFSFFLQALLSELTSIQEIKSRIEKGLRAAYKDYLANERKEVEERRKRKETLVKLTAELNRLTDEKSKIESEMEQVRDQKNPDKKSAQVLGYNLSSIKNQIQEIEPEVVRLNDLVRAESELKPLDDLKVRFNFLNEHVQDSSLYGSFRQASELLDDEYSFLIKQREKLTIRIDPDGRVTKTNKVVGSIDSELRRLNQIRAKLLEFEVGSFLTQIVRSEMETKGIDFRSYVLPLSFFLFIYFTGFLITLPLINSVFTGQASTTIIPLFNTNAGIPLLVVEWGFLGGLVYTSISLLTRFLRKDIIPRVYFNSSFRLLLSAVVAIVIYFFYMLSFGNKVPPLNETPPQLLLLCFAAGVAPVQFLIRVADTQFSKLYKGWRRRDTAGNRTITQLEGINSITAERLGEEGYDYIQQIALCDPEDLANKTKFEVDVVFDWKDQGVLYLLTADILVAGANKQNKQKAKYLNEILNEKSGIRRFSQLYAKLSTIYSDGSATSEETKKVKQAFFRGLTLIDDPGKDFDKWDFNFEIIMSKGAHLLYGETQPI